MPSSARKLGKPMSRQGSQQFVVPFEPGEREIICLFEKVSEQEQVAQEIARHNCT